MKAGAVDFIEKPFDSEVLLSALREAFRRLSSKTSTGEREEGRRGPPAVADTARDGCAQGTSARAAEQDDRLRSRISPRTVEYSGNLMTKLGVRSLSEALRIAFAARGRVTNGLLSGLP